MSTSINNNIFCLYLMGGQSSRMNFNKFNIKYNNFSYWKYCYKTLSLYFKTYLSLNNNIKNFFYFKDYNFLSDIFSNSFGPISGILSSIKFNSNVTWFVVSCDFVFLNNEIISHFLNNRNNNYEANVILNNSNNPEPLFATYEIKSYEKMFNYFLNGYNCLKTFIFNKIKTNFIKIDSNILNINDHKNLNFFFSQQIKIKILYFSLFKDYSQKDFEFFYFLNIISLSDLLLIVVKKYKITLTFNYVKFIVNNNIEERDYKIANKDNIIFLLPVSGG